ncbi:MAG: single-stranded DNA-binding protein, partial [Anaerolineae bacterium]|nr:single-stranded DNA-binding protein [Anaerolineae bacterium]
MYHKVTIIGRLGNDPELRYSPTGRPVTHFSVAANRRYTSADGS